VGHLPDELRLAITLSLNALLLASAYRLVRRWVSDTLQAAVDAGMLWYLSQYVLVALLGLAGILSGTSIVIGGFIVFGLMLAGSKTQRTAPAREAIGWPVIAALCVVLAYVGAIVWVSRFAPVIANDSLAYQLPAAVQWLQTGHLTLLPVWFFNPANSYSPLAGSTFVAWLMGPMGNDALARFVEAPALIFLFLGSVQLARKLGANWTTASLLGVAVACGRPFISQTILAKDDLPLAGFLICVLVALSKDCLGDSLGCWRLGAAVGLMLATKYTATFSLIPILLAADAPWRAGWRWRKYALAVGVASLLFLPWYLRNWICFGSPVFPFDLSIAGIHLFEGPLRTLKSDQLKSWGGILKTLTGTYYSLPPVPALVLLISWSVCLARVPMRSALTRACLLGPMIAIVVFILRSPAAEMRFIAPSLAVLIVSNATLAPLRPRLAAAAATVLAVAAAITSFNLDGLLLLAPTAGILLISLIAAYVLAVRLPRRGALITAGFVLVLLGIWVYIQWPAYLRDCRDSAIDTWRGPYAGLADGWAIIREQTELNCTVAYANTFQIYPLYGFELSRRVVYVPGRPGLHTLDQLPVMHPVTGEDVPGEVSRVTTEGSDATTWLRNLLTSGANYLIVGKLNLANPQQLCHPPELDYASANGFDLLYDNPAVSVYRIAIHE
jgi:hypothetical protein